MALKAPAIPSTQLPVPARRATRRAAGDGYGASQTRLATPNMIPTAVSIAWKAMPAASPFVSGVPWAWSAIAIVADVTPMFPGVIGSREAMSSAGTITTAAASGRPMPRAAATAVAEASRPAVARAIQPISRRAAVRSRPSARKASKRWEGVRRATIAAPIPIATSAAAISSGQSGHEPRGGAADDERAEDDGAGGAEGGEGSPGRPEALAVREHAGEQADPDGVAGPEGHEGVDERPGAVAGARLGERETPAAEPDRTAPGGGGSDDGDEETDAGEPEPLRVGGGNRVERRSDPVPEELGRGHGGEEGDQNQRSSGDSAASDPGLDLGECCVHVLLFMSSDVQRNLRLAGFGAGLPSKVNDV